MDKALQRELESRDAIKTYHQSYPKNYSILYQQTVHYQSITETMVTKSETQRRGGIHVESPLGLSWGSGWGGISTNTGVYMASTDGRTEVWNTMQPVRDHHGRCDVSGDGSIMKPNTLYWMTDLTPHAALPALEDGMRQFIRVVSSQVDVWYDKHSTRNPLGIMPKAKIITESKFH